ncbi:MAG: hypothetical protein IKV53_06105 [Clostridia bacterium]|nr:hypothetical protein [Clostridia bacterium]
MNKKTLFFIDDVIWVFRDLTRQRPASLFDNPFMRLLLELHTLYGVKTQLNVFYQTDTFYGNDLFTLDEMTDAYKSEFEACSDWLKLGFHSRQEFPDYPYINATYEHIAEDYALIKNAVLRFAGEKSFSISTTPHWRPISRAACHALYDGGIRMMSATCSNLSANDTDLSLLPYGHAGRFLQNRQPETALFVREFGDPALKISIRGYNNISTEESERTRYTCDYVVDGETGLCFKELGGAPSLNVATKEEIAEVYPTLVDREFLCYATHEQYFYPDYYAYQPDYPEKLKLAAKIISESGYEYVFGGDLLK